MNINQNVVDSQQIKIAYEKSNKQMNYRRKLTKKENDSSTEALNMYYSRLNGKVKSKYSYKNSCHWIEIFKSEYEKIKPTSAKEYDVRRKKTYPTWRTTANMVNLNKWNELLRYCDLITYNKTKVYKRKKVCKKINVRRKFDIDELKKRLTFEITSFIK